MTSDNLRAGFAGAGIFPINVERPLARVVEARQPPPTPPEPRTPKCQRGNNELPFTPKNKGDLTLQLKKLHKDLEGFDCVVRGIGNKTSDLIDYQNTVIAELKAQNTHFKDQLYL